MPYQPKPPTPVATGRWLYNQIEDKGERKQLREFDPNGLLRAPGRVEMTTRFPSEIDSSGITVRPFTVPEP